MNMSANNAIRTIHKSVNGVSVDGLEGTIEAIKATPGIAKFKFRVRNQWIDGAQNASTVGPFFGAGQEQPRSDGFVLEADEPPLLLGKDGAPSPTEHLLHALAACLTTSMVYLASRQGVVIDEIESTLEGDVDLQGFLKLDSNIRSGFQGIRVAFKVKADISDEKLQEIVQLGPQHSPVYDSVTKGVPVSVTAERM
jgi:uncharacterized OsmC-like protein